MHRTTLRATWCSMVQLLRLMFFFHSQADLLLAAARNNWDLQTSFYTTKPLTLRCYIYTWMYTYAWCSQAPAWRKHIISINRLSDNGCVAFDTNHHITNEATLERKLYKSGSVWSGLEKGRQLPEQGFEKKIGTLVILFAMFLKFLLEATLQSSCQKRQRGRPYKTWNRYNVRLWHHGLWIIIIS